MKKNTQKKKFHFKSTTMITILLVFALALLFMAEYGYLNKDKVARNLLAEKGSAGETVTSAPLPAELTTIGSNQYLVNKKHSLPESYVPEKLTTPYLNNSVEVQVTEEAGNKAKEMIAAAKDAGITLYVSSGYVSFSAQKDLYDAYVSLAGEGQAALSYPQAGYSEHQTGLALDFARDAKTTSEDISFADIDAGKWLHDHAHEFGFILRYPKDKESITGYTYMPWHYRYVGTDVANAMFAKDPEETMEEYYQVEN